MNRHIKYDLLLIIYNNFIQQAENKKEKTGTNVGKLMWESYISGITDFMETIEEIGLEENTNE